MTQRVQRTGYAIRMIVAAPFLAVAIVFFAIWYIITDTE